MSNFSNFILNRVCLFVCSLTSVSIVPVLEIGHVFSECFAEVESIVKVGIMLRVPSHNVNWGLSLPIAIRGQVPPSSLV